MPLHHSLAASARGLFEVCETEGKSVRQKETSTKGNNVSLQPSSSRESHLHSWRLCIFEVSLLVTKISASDRKVVGRNKSTLHVVALLVCRVKCSHSSCCDVFLASALLSWEHLLPAGSLLTSRGYLLIVIYCWFLYFVHKLDMFMSIVTALLCVFPVKSRSTLSLQNWRGSSSWSLQKLEQPNNYELCTFMAIQLISRNSE